MSAGEAANVRDDKSSYVYKYIYAKGKDPLSSSGAAKLTRRGGAPLTKYFFLLPLPPRAPTPSLSLARSSSSSAVCLQRVPSLSLSRVYSRRPRSFDFFFYPKCESYTAALSSSCTRLRSDFLCGEIIIIIFFNLLGRAYCARRSAHAYAAARN